MPRNPDSDTSSSRLPFCSPPQPPSRPLAIDINIHITITYFLYHILVILVSLILRWSWKMPYIRASLVGGHPGT